MAEIRIFWNVVDLLPGMVPPNGVQVIRRTPYGIITDSVGYAYNIPLEREYTEDMVAYIDVRIVRENDNQQIPENYRFFSIDDTRSEEDNSNSIALALNLLTPAPGNEGYIQSGHTVGVVQRHNHHGDYTTHFIPENMLINYSIWCELHNKLMIQPTRVFPRHINAINTTGPRVWPLDVASSWQRQWSVVVTTQQNTRIEIIKSFNKYNSAKKSAEKYIKHILNDKRFRNFPDFKTQSFIHNDLTVTLHKEKDLK